MCILIDANMASSVFSSPPHEDGAPVIRWILLGNGVLILGGKLTHEILKISSARSTLIQLQKAGKAISMDFPNASFLNNEIAACISECSSNDSHVIALARLSGARTLVTNDRLAMDDFRNKKLVDKPRGRIYQRKEHARLLIHTKSCGHVQSG